MNADAWVPPSEVLIKLFQDVVWTSDFNVFIYLYPFIFYDHSLVVAKGLG